MLVGTEVKSLRDGQAQMELTSLIDALRSEAEVKDAYQEASLAHRAGLLSIWLTRKAADADAPHRTPATEMVAAFSSLVESDFGAGHGIAEYAARLGVTPTHLARVCRATSGKPALDILKSRRLFEAQRLLADSEVPVSDIAQKSGFGSAAYFSRAFRQATGSAPTTFRRDFSGKGRFPTS
mgnify:CR=1 FL=1